MIKIKDLTKDYMGGGVVTHVLRGINLEIPEGQFVSIIGPSGAGKSTLLYQMGLLDKPTGGSIVIDGKDVTQLKEKEATKYRLDNFGFVFQDYSLVPELTAIENIIIPSLMLGIPYSKAVRQARQMLAELEVSNVENNLPSQMSGGEQQRVSIARAVVRDPKILFADEPTASLDTKRSQEVLDVLKRLNKQGQTIVMVTHEMEFARLAHRIVEIKDGIVQKDHIVK